jgi:hypothetical protein
MESYNVSQRRVSQTLDRARNGVDKMVEATPEEGGLRIKILANRGKAGAGIQTKFPLTGDFEITVSYEILSADKPTSGYGVGVHLTISPKAWKEKRAALARCWTHQSGSGFQPVIIIAEPQPVNRSGWEKSDTMKGQLRFRREGAKLFYLINEDLGQPFREVFQCEYGTDPIELVRLVANPGNSPAAVDARLLDVRMHWGGLPDHARTAPSVGKVTAGLGADKGDTGHGANKASGEKNPDKATNGQAPDLQGSPPPKGWLATSLAVGLAITLVLVLAVGLVIYVRQHRGSKSPKSNLTDNEDVSRAPPPSVAIVCSACGRELKIKAELAGKKVKCPHCRMAVRASPVGKA